MKKTKISAILKLLMLKKDIKTAQLARLTNIPQQTLHRITTGVSPRPHKQALNNIASYFDISVEQLKGEKQLPKEFFPAAGFETILAKKSTNVPLLTWDQLKEIEKINIKIEENGIDTFDNIITINLGFSEKCFGLKMNDSSMDPYFPQGSLLIIDPEKAYKDRSFVLVKLHEENLYLFRQILVDGQHKYLKPLNPDLENFKMRLLNEQDEILGVLIEARKIYEDAFY